MNLEDSIKQAIRDVPDFQKPGCGRGTLSRRGMR
jgi:hypothetical protein